MADSGRQTLVFDIIRVHVNFLRNAHVHFTTTVFLTLYMYTSCLKNVHVQFDNFSSLKRLEHVIIIRIPFCFSFTQHHMNLLQQGMNEFFFNITNSVRKLLKFTYRRTNMVFLDTDVYKGQRFTESGIFIDIKSYPIFRWHCFAEAKPPIATVLGSPCSLSLNRMLTQSPPI